MVMQAAFMFIAPQGDPQSHVAKVATPQVEVTTLAVADYASACRAAEELVAELSSAMLGAELGLPVTHLDSHASYIEHWLKLLKDDDRAILTAAAKAEEAASLLLKLGGRVTPGQFDDASDDAALAA